MERGRAEENGFDPRGLLAALHRNYVGYVLIGGLARVIRGTDEVTSGVDICPSLRRRTWSGLARRSTSWRRRRADRRRLAVDEESLRDEPVLRLRTSLGELNVVAEPAGTRRGFDDLRRGATRRSTSGRGCGRGWPRSLIWRGCRLRSRTSSGASPAVRRSSCGSWRSSARVSCGGSWRSRSGWSGHSGSSATSASTCDSQLDPAVEARARGARSGRLPAQAAFEPRLSAGELERALARRRGAGGRAARARGRAARVSVRVRRVGRGALVRGGRGRARPARRARGSSGVAARVRVQAFLLECQSSLSELAGLRARARRARLGRVVSWRRRGRASRRRGG